MSVKIVKKVADQASKKTDQKINCDICHKVLVKGSLKRHNETQHKVTNISKKKEATTEKTEDTPKKNEDSPKKNEDTPKKKEDSEEKENEASNEEVTWSKVWVSNISAPPVLSTQDMDQYLREKDTVYPTFSTGELDDFLLEKNDSILDQIVELENNLEVREEWFKESSQNTFGSDFGKELRRLSLQPVKSCKDCKELKTEYSDLRKQHDKLLIRTTNTLKSAEEQKLFLRKQLKLAEKEVEQNRDKWSSDVDSLTEEINNLKAEDADKRSKSNLKKELEQYKKALADKVKENLELSNKLETAKSQMEHENKMPDSTNQEKQNETQKEKCETTSIKCGRCRFVAKSTLELRGHAKFVHLTCKFCNKFCNNLIIMDEHMKTNHPREYRPVCEPCKMLFPNANTLEAHKKKKHTKNYSCQVCKDRFEHKSELMKHMKHVHTEKTNEHKKKEYNFGCIICDFRESTEDQISKHMAEVHNIEDAKKDNDLECFNCPLCEYNADSEELVIKHLEDVHKLVDEPKPRKINKPCRYYKQNRCFKGEDCKFTHEKTFENTYETKDNHNEHIKCKHGLNCTYLKQNRCSFYHEIAAQPRKESNLRQPTQGGRADPRPPSGHDQQSNVSLRQVKLCRDGNKCDKSRACRYRHYNPDHYKVDFIQRNSNQRK